MDYLPQPSRAFPHVRVPFVAQVDYDWEDFATFPHRCGFGGDFSSYSEEELASLAQSWLYFGSLDTFLGTKVSRDDFRVKHPEGDHVFAQPLVELLSQWLATTITPILGRDVVKKTTASAANGLIHRATTMRAFLEVVLEKTDILETLPQSATGHLPAILLSVRVLTAALSGVLDESVFQSDFGALTNKYEQGPVEQLRFISASSYQLRRASARCLLEDMVTNGWCPYMARKLCLTYNYAVVYYLSRLRGYHDISHRNCSERACIAHNVNMSDYNTKHTTKECQCAHVHVDRDQLHSIISNGGIPIVSFKKVAGQTELELKKMTQKTSYVAFSHVWSDGLGNATANSLPRCQIERLARYLEELELPKMAVQQAVVNVGPLKMDLQRMTRDLEISSFWFDTLCIPVGDDYMDLKVQAINSMAAIYSGALQVLVVDSSLENLSLKSPDVEVCEMLGRVSISPWMGRSWTFQEAAISAIRQIRCLESSFNPTAVRFGHPTAYTKILDPDSLSEWLPSFWHLAVSIGRMVHRNDNDPQLARRLVTYMSTDIKVPLVALLARPLKHTMIKEFMGAKLIGIEYKTPYHRFMACWNALCSRTTTKQEDVHLIFANILGFSATMVWYITDPAERMAALLLSLPDIPLALFFSSTTVRDRPGENHYNRWLPLYPSGEPGAMNPRVSVSDAGLHLSSRPTRSTDIDEEMDEDESTASSTPLAFRMNSRLQGIQSQNIILEGLSKKLQLAVSFHRSGKDSFAASLGQGESFLVFTNDDLGDDSLADDQRTGGSVFQGALFQALNEVTSSADAKSNDSTKGVIQKHRVAFDCPVSATLATDPGRDLDVSSSVENPGLQANLLPEHWQLDICTSKFKSHIL